MTRGYVRMNQDAVERLSISMQSPAQALAGPDQGRSTRRKGSSVPLSILGHLSRSQLMCRWRSVPAATISPKTSQVPGSGVA